jgi:hypothetical protein
MCGRLVLDCGGGLGNQMFEYAAALAFAQRWNRRLEVVRPITKYAQWNGFARPFQLAEFRITVPVREAGRLDRLFFSRNPRLREAQGVARALMGAETLQESLPYRYQPHVRPRKARSDVYMVGNWQAAGYVEEVADRLRGEFVLRRAAEGANREYAARIAAMRCPVSVHLRMGDYAQIKTASGASIVLPITYYNAALAVLGERFPEAELVVFSDEPQQARELLAGRRGCVFVEGNGAETAYEDLRLMSMCRHHVIANSSFSWWGAWLNPAPEKLVVTPRYWGNTQESDHADLRMAGWLALDNLRV